MTHEPSRKWKFHGRCEHQPSLVPNLTEGVSSGTRQVGEEQTTRNLREEYEQERRERPGSRGL